MTKSAPGFGTVERRSLLRTTVLGLVFWLALLSCGAPPSRPSVAPAAPPPTTTAQPSRPPVLDGVWRGVLAGKLHLALTITREGEGYRGVLDSIDQGATLPIDRVVVDGETLRFEISAVNGSFEGKVDANRIDGTWTQHGRPQPLSLAKGDKAPTETSRTEPPTKPLDAPVDIAVPQPPAVLRANDHTHLVYELHITNFSRRELSLKRIEVQSNGRSLGRYEGVDLALMCNRPGVPDAVGTERLRIGPGLRAVAFMWVTTDSAPSTLDHSVTVQMTGDSDELTVPSLRATVGSARAPVVAAPLRGGWWLAGNGPSNASRHRRALIPIAGRAHVAQRFAIDWVKVGDDSGTFTGDPLKNASYHAYGQEALAVGDGVVADVKDGIAENVPGAESRAVPITLENIAGNHVIVDLGGGFYGFWAHLQPGSLRVRVGDRVKRGQVIGLVGNSGNSTEPHLHFHVSDGRSVLGSEGVPYALEKFEARAPSKSGEKPGPAVPRTKQLPMENETVSFP
jgi:murein DD-endopeptidase